jgi:ribosomal protein S6
MRYYDLTYLITPEFSEKEAKDFSQKVLNLLQDQGGILENLKDPQKISLAYQIEKKKTAWLVSLSFFLASSKIQDIRNELSKNKEILRFLVFQKKLPKAKIPEKEEMKIPLAKKPPEKKVELKEIEKKLEEILGE